MKISQMAYRESQWILRRQYKDEKGQSHFPTSTLGPNDMDLKKFGLQSVPVKMIVWKGK